MADKTGERKTHSSSSMETLSNGIIYIEDGNSILSGSEGGINLTRNLSNLSLKLTSSAKKLIDPSSATKNESNASGGGNSNLPPRSDEVKEVKELKKLIRNKGQVSEFEL